MRASGKKVLYGGAQLFNAVAMLGIWSLAMTQLAVDAGLHFPGGVSAVWSFSGMVIVIMIVHFFVKVGLE
jgi:hypothetical protein